VDLYRFTVTAGQVVDFDIDTPLNGPGGLGSFLRLFNAQGQELAFNDNAAAPGESVGFDAYLRFTFAAAGTFYIGVSNANNTLYDPVTGNGDTAGGQNSTGSYRLIVQEVPANVATLTVTINAFSISESGTAIGTVTRANADVSQSLTVTLSSSDTTEATVPATVVIPANQTFVDFTITAVNDQVVDGAQTVTITATAAGFVAGAQSLRITDSSSLWHNVQNPLDVNNSGTITINDASLIVNFLNRFGAGPVPQVGSPPPYYDVNSDNFITASDALIVINYLNSLLNQQAAVAGFQSEGPLTSAMSTGSASAAAALPASPPIDDHPSTSSSRTLLRARRSVVSVDNYFAEIGSRSDARWGA
jgi:dockerin type I repeat protein/pre-peptidase